MSTDDQSSDLRDLSTGVDVADLADGRPLFGEVDGEPIYLVQVDDEIRAFGAACTHYGGPLAGGLVHDGTVRCPWHHACFSIEDGSVEGGPAFDPLPRFEVSIEGGRARLGRKLPADPVDARRSPPSAPDSIVVVGAGPAGQTAVDTLLREGFAGTLHLVDPDPRAPYDRPNLSKDFLSGDAPEDWLSLRSREFYEAHGVERIEDAALALDTEAHRITLESGGTLHYGTALLATGSVPRTISVPGVEQEHVHTLRSLEDCHAIIDGTHDAGRVVVVGASFIGMEVAASLRSRGLDVVAVAPEEIPFETTLGRVLGERVRTWHEEHDVGFRMGRTVMEIRPDRVVLDDGQELPADLVVIGVGVRPDTTLAREANLDVDGGVVVDQYLRTSDPDVFAAGDIARYPHAETGVPTRIEHWVVAGRQGRTAARNMVGRTEPFEDVPFFWTRHFGHSIAYVGHADTWEEAAVGGDCGENDCSVSFSKNGHAVALATIGRDAESLRTEAEWGDGR